MRHARRAITIPAVIGTWILLLVSLPLALPVLAILDLVRGRSFPWFRCYVFFFYYACLQVAGLSSLLIIWIWHVGGDRDARGYWDGNLRIQRTWLRLMGWGLLKIYSATIEMSGVEDFQNRPFIMLLRHASVADPLIPGLLFGDQHLEMRFVMKNQLLFDPCLDINGNRLFFRFVKRGGRQTEKEVGRVAELMDDTGPGRGPLICPEGTIYSKSKSARIKEKIDRGEIEGGEQVRGLEAVLPPRLPGTLAIFDRMTNEDVIFIAHAGLERMSYFRDFLRGDLIGARLKVEMWSYRAEEVPSDREGRISWLYENWKRVDRMVRDHARENEPS